jgi:hypothetical protein
MNQRVQDKDSSAIFTNDAWREEGTEEDRARREYVCKRMRE